MTGAEKETLSVLLETLREFRIEVRGDVQEVKDAVKGIDARVRAMEEKDIAQVAVAASTAANVVANTARAERRQLSLRAWLTIAVSASAAVSTLVIKLFELLTQ